MPRHVANDHWQLLSGISDFAHDYGFRAAPAGRIGEYGLVVGYRVRRRVFLGDPWNVRLIPYYLLAVTFVVPHTDCGRTSPTRCGDAEADRLIWAIIASRAVLAAFTMADMPRRDLA